MNRDLDALLRQLLNISHGGLVFQCLLCPIVIRAFRFGVANDTEIVTIFQERAGRGSAQAQNDNYASQ